MGVKAPIFTQLSTPPPTPPPPRPTPCRLHKGEPPQPSGLTERRRICRKAASHHFKTEQFQPILEARQRNEIAAPRIALLAAQCAAHTPQAARIETADDQIALGHQHPLPLAQGLMRLRSR